MKSEQAKEILITLTTAYIEITDLQPVERFRKKVTEEILQKSIDQIKRLYGHLVSREAMEDLKDVLDPFYKEQIKIRIENKEKQALKNLKN